MDSTHKQPGSEAPPSGSVGRPSELRLLLPEEHTNVRGVLGGGGVAHAVLLALIMAVLVWTPAREYVAPEIVYEPTDLVFLTDPGPGGGGGGGGDNSPEPAPVAEVPPTRPPDPEPIPVPEPVVVPEPDPEPEPPPQIAAEIAAISSTSIPAVVGNVAAFNPDAPLGPGRGGGAGTGRGGGIGEGDGDGLGPGTGGNFGGGVRQVGNGVLPPVDIYKEKPSYTSEAMLRRIQGTVALDCIVLASGTVGDCKVAKSLDSNLYGLDDQAMRAAKRFKFRPATYRGEPVDVLVRIELDFNMR
jgi:periplasmic protein TonB